MNVFNSLGSNYSFTSAVKIFFSYGTKRDTKSLIKRLESKFEGKAFLFYKGREAIEVCLKSLKLNSDYEVIANGFTCFAVYKAIQNAGLKCRLLDIEKDSLNFNAKSLEKEIELNKNIKVVIIQNTLGYPCDIENISKICKKNNIFLIEDLAHSAGSFYLNKREAGSYGDFIILSFSQDKIIDGISGGALINRKSNIEINLEKTQKPKFSTQFKDRIYPILTIKIRFLYSFGLGKFYHFILKRLNLLSKPMDDLGKISSLPDWYCKIIYEQFINLEKNISHRKKISNIYFDELLKDFLIKDVSEKISLSTNLRFPILVNNRTNVIKKLKEKGIHVSDIWYDAPISPKRYMEKIDYDNNCPNSEYISKMILNLPTHINIDENKARLISKIINSCHE